MAEFCLDCYNELHGTYYDDGDVNLDYDLCEDCGEWKLTIADFCPRAVSRESLKKDSHKRTTLFQDLRALIKQRKR